MDKKKLRNDLILIISLFLVMAITLTITLSFKVRTNLVARIFFENNVVETIDLSKNEDKDYFVDGKHGKLHIHTHEGAIAVLESNCPHQDCVHMGYVSESGKPIICAYNAVSIVIDGNNLNDVEI